MLAAVPALCVAIVALYAAMRLGPRAADRGRVAVRLALLAAAAFIGEDSMVRAYGFYGYGRHLGPLVDRVPLLVPLIWAVVIDSATELAGRIAPRRRALAAAAIVLCDASLIEPVAVRAGLWSWSEGGFFGVPFVGVFGWAAFTAAAVHVHERLGRQPARGALSLGAALLAPALLTHAAILVSWWIAFRWLRGDAPDGAVAVLAWIALPAVAVAALRLGLRRRVPLASMLVRVPGALFFYALLGLHGRGDLVLVAYCLAFVWPYLALLDLRGARISDASASAGHRRDPVSS